MRDITLATPFDPVCTPLGPQRTLYYIEAGITDISTSFYVPIFELEVRIRGIIEAHTDAFEVTYREKNLSPNEAERKEVDKATLTIETNGKIKNLQCVSMRTCLFDENAKYAMISMTFTAFDREARPEMDDEAWENFTKAALKQIEAEGETMLKLNDKTRMITTTVL